jgi:23S rRNA (cytidine1920-2'-O)/16S rRNA (cytidine1409-2'-O)-methyltransferase
MKRKTSSKRLDLVLVERGLAKSPQRALAMILAGEVHVNGERSGKAGVAVADDARIEITSRAQKFVSRGGVKLEGALEDFRIDPTGRLCLDIGSSNGGFTDCLLQRGAARVYAVDVNVDQLDWKLRQDPRVTRIERNARELRKKDIPELVSLVVADVSFISVGKVIAPATAVAGPGADFLILIKPQFELRREEITTGGVVTDKQLHEKAILAVRKKMEDVGLECSSVRPSHLPGAEGNQEYFLHARKKTME